MVKKIKKYKNKNKQKQKQTVIVNIHKPTRAKSTAPRATSRPLHQPLVIHSNNGGGGFNPLQLELMKNQLSSEINTLKHQLKDYVSTPLQNNMNFNRVNAEQEQAIEEPAQRQDLPFGEPVPPAPLETLRNPEQVFLQRTFPIAEYPELYKQGKILLSNPAFKSAYKALTNKKYTNKQDALSNLNRLEGLI